MKMISILILLSIKYAYGWPEIIEVKCDSPSMMRTINIKTIEGIEYSRYTRGCGYYDENDWVWDGKVVERIGHYHYSRNVCYNRSLYKIGSFKDGKKNGKWYFVRTEVPKDYLCDASEEEVREKRLIANYSNGIPQGVENIYQPKINSIAPKISEVSYDGKIGRKIRSEHFSKNRRTHTTEFFYSDNTDIFPLYEYPHENLLNSTDPPPL